MPGLSAVSRALTTKRRRGLDVRRVAKRDGGDVPRNIADIVQAQGKSVILSTHGMELAERMCDHICLISRGRVVLTGELGAIKRQLGGNSFRLVAEGDLERVQSLPEVEQAVAQNGIVKLMLRPEADGPEVLRQLVQFLRVHEFRSEEPELEQIFLKAVRDAA